MLSEMLTVLRWSMSILLVKSLNEMLFLSEAHFLLSDIDLGGSDESW
jgi:hypothetical protein